MWHGGDWDWQAENDLSWPSQMFWREADMWRFLDISANQERIDLGYSIGVDGQNLGDIVGDAIAAFADGSHTPASFVEENRQRAQDIIDRFWE
jgi:DNA-binding ferritin-like protein (Dps family)